MNLFKIPLDKTLNTSYNILRSNGASDSEVIMDAKEFEALFPEYLVQRLPGEIKHLHKRCLDAKETSNRVYQAKTYKVEFVMMKSPSQNPSFGIKYTITGDKVPGGTYTFTMLCVLSEKETEVNWKESYDYVKQAIGKNK